MHVLVCICSNVRQFNHIFACVLMNNNFSLLYFPAVGMMHLLAAPAVAAAKAGTKAAPRPAPKKGIDTPYGSYSNIRVVVAHWQRAQVGGCLGPMSRLRAGDCGPAHASPLGHGQE